MRVVLNRGHVRERMDERGVSESDIHAALADQISVLPGHNGNRCCVVGRVEDGRTLKIWTVYPVYPDTETVIVKSVAWKE